MTTLVDSIVDATAPDDRPAHSYPASRGHIGRIVVGSLATGLVAALLLVAAPVHLD